MQPTRSPRSANIQAQSIELPNKRRAATLRYPRISDPVTEISRGAVQPWLAESHAVPA